MRAKLSFKTIVFLLVLILFVTIVLSVGMGSTQISLSKTIDILFEAVSGRSIFHSDFSMVEQNTILYLRLPRVLLGGIVGASLAICGVSMQALVRNRLADPFILGVSSGASAFATLDMVFGAFAFLGTYRLSLSAFLGALCTIIIVYILSLKKGRIQITQLLLCGVAVSMIMDGFTRMITLSAPNALGMHNAEFWMSGSLAGAKWEYLTLPTIIMILCILYLGIHYRTLNVLLLGENVSPTLGINVKSMQKKLILISSLLAGVTISVSGSIGFVGLMCPHFSRLLAGSDHKKVLILSPIIGAILVIWTDVVARMLFAPEELPIGILTAILGGPIFILLLKRRQKGESL